MDLTDDEKEVVRKLAAGDHSVRLQAIKMFRARLMETSKKENVDVRSISSEMAFMSEIDNPCPCSILRAKYREEVLKNA